MSNKKNIPFMMSRRELLSMGDELEFQSSIFQPVGGMDQIAQAIYREVAELIQFNAKVTKIEQDDQALQ